MLSLLNLLDSRPGHRERVVRDLPLMRFLCMLAGVLLLVYGFVYQVTDPGSYDPFWLRGVLAGLCVLLVAASYWNEWVRQNYPLFYRALIYVMIIWNTAISAANHFAPNWSLGLLLTFSLCVIAYSVVSYTWYELPIYSVISVLMVIGALLIAPVPFISPSLLVTCLVAIGLMSSAITAERIYVDQERRVSEARNRVILEQSTDGIFMAYLDGLQLVDVNPAIEKMLAIEREILTEYNLGELLLSGSESLSKRLENAEMNEEVRQSGKMRTSTGEVLEVEVRANKIQYAGEIMVCGLLRDIGEQKEVERNLRSAKESAERMLDIKTSLFNNLTHEVNTPLTGIIGFAEILEDEVDEVYRSFATDIRKCGERLRKTLDDVLVLAKLEGGKMSVSPKKVDLVQLAEAKLQLFQALAEKKHVACRLDAETKPLYLHSDRFCVESILNNLISNAVKFTESGHVTVQLQNVADGVLMRVEDTGVGISPDFAPIMFQEFTQESDGLTREHQGVGLGLSVTKSLTELLGGKIEHSSSSNGTIFDVYLPDLNTTNTT